MVAKLAWAITGSPGTMALLALVGWGLDRQCKVAVVWQGLGNNNSLWGHRDKHTKDTAAGFLTEESYKSEAQVLEWSSECPGVMDIETHAYKHIYSCFPKRNRKI